jgi:hypothetical protein
MKTCAFFLTLFVSVANAFVVLPQTQRRALMVTPTDFVEVDYDGENS